MTRIVLGFVLFATVGCRANDRSADTSFDLRTERSRVGERVSALSSHVAEQEKVEAAHPARIAPPKMRPPTAAEMKTNQASPPPDVTAYRAHIALLGEKQLLTDMQVSLASMDANGNAASARARLTEMDTRLGAIEASQRERDDRLGIRRPRQP